MPARISPSSGLDPPPESCRTAPGSPSGPIVHGPSGFAVTTPDCRTTSTIRTTATPSGTNRTASESRRSMGPSTSGMEATTAARTEPPVSQRVSSWKSARSPAVCSGTGVRASTSVSSGRFAVVGSSRRGRRRRGTRAPRGGRPGAGTCLRRYVIERPGRPSPRRCAVDQAGARRRGVGLDGRLPAGQPAAAGEHVDAGPEQAEARRRPAAPTTSSTGAAGRGPPGRRPPP